MCTVVDHMHRNKFMFPPTWWENITLQLFNVCWRWYTCIVQITFIFIGQTRLVFGNRVCTCVTKHSNAFQTFLNWLKNLKRVWHEPKLHILRLSLFANFDLWSVICELWVGLVSFKTNVSETAGQIHLSDNVRCKGHRHLSANVRCKMHQTRLQVKRTSRFRLKCKLKSVWK